MLSHIRDFLCDKLSHKKSRSLTDDSWLLYFTSLDTALWRVKITTKVRVRVSGLYDIFLKEVKTPNVSKRSVSRMV